MVAFKLVASLCIGLQATAQEILPEEFDIAQSESLSLLQLRSHKSSPHSQLQGLNIESVQDNGRCSGNYAQRATFASVEACAAAWAGEGLQYLAFWQTTRNPARLQGLCIGWTNANCNIIATGTGKFNALYRCSEQDDAAAVGDPHLTLSDGTKQDMCCDDGPCKACDLSDVDALLQEDAQAIDRVQDNGRCSGNYAQRATFATVEACAAAWAGEGLQYLAFWQTTRNPARLQGLCIGWTNANCNIVATGNGKFNALYRCSEEDTAAAVGDPHLTFSDGTKQDMCCDDGPCKACDLSDVDVLLQEDAQGLERVQENGKCSGNYAKRATFATVEACAAAWAGEGLQYLAFWQTTRNPARLQGLCIGWTSANCNIKATGNGKFNALYKCSEDDDAAAVGDPHLTFSDGTKQDMCCDDGPCKACDLSDVDVLLQEDDQGLERVQENGKCSGNYAKRQTFASVEACAAAWAGEGIKYLAFWQTTRNPARLQGLCIGWTSANCNIKATGNGKFNALYRCQEDDDAAAVGDPHLEKSNKAKEDLCCDGGECHLC